VPEKPGKNTKQRRRYGPMGVNQRARYAAECLLGDTRGRRRMSNYPELDGRITFAVFAILAGLLSVLLVASTNLPAPRVPAELLPYFRSHQSSYVLAAITVLVWVVVAIPFVVGLGALLSAKGSTLAFAATLLSAGGILLLGFATFAFVGAFLAIVAASDVAPSPAEATYQAAIWGNLSFFLTDPGLMTLGFGQFLFAWLAWNSSTVPRFVSWVGFLGGLAGLLTLVVYQTSLLAMIQIGAFGVWGIATGVILLRRKAVASP
jgi:hypothetical protein